MRSAAAAANDDCVALLLAARARLLAKRFKATREALADALRAISLFGGDQLNGTAAKAAAARLARTVAAVLAAEHGYHSPGIHLAADFLALAMRFEPHSDVKATDADRAAYLSSCSKALSLAQIERRQLAWRRRRCDAEDLEAARHPPDANLEVVVTVVGLGCGRCGTSSLATLLSSCLRPSHSWVSHESWLPDCRIVLWQRDEAAAKRRLAEWTARRRPLVGDVNYAHLPSASAYLNAGAKVVALKRDRQDTVASFFKWTEPGGAPGSLASRDHWRIHDASQAQFDEWDLTFPKYQDANTKLDAITAYYDDYYKQLYVAHFVSFDTNYARGSQAYSFSQDRAGAKVRVSPRYQIQSRPAGTDRLEYAPFRHQIFLLATAYRKSTSSCGVSPTNCRRLFDFLGITHLGARPVLGIHKNALA